MIILRQNNFSIFKRKSAIQKFGEAFKESPLVPAASIGLSTTGVYLSARRNKQMKEQNQKQLEAMEHLTKSLGRVNRTMERSNSLNSKNTPSGSENSTNNNRLGLALFKNRRGW